MAKGGWSPLLDTQYISTREKVKSLRVSNPNLTQIQIAREVNRSRSLVRKILIEEGLLQPQNRKPWGISRVKKEGYILRFTPNHPKANGRGYVREHVLIWEEANGRQLPPDWVIHHINGIGNDNRKENLLAIPKGNHHYALLMQALKGRIRKLEAENRKLKAERKLI